MRKPLTDEDLIERGALDGRVAFAIAAFVALAGLLALLDRVGAPETLVRLLGPLFVLAALATVGVLLRSMRVSRYYAAGRAVPTPYVGFAAVATCAGLAIPFLPPAPETLGAPAAAGAAIGLVAAFVGFGPYIRKTGAFSVVDLIATRFPNVALRLGLAVTVAAVGALVGLAGFDIAIGPVTELFGLPRAVVAAGLAFVLVLVAAPGGVSGIVWAANGAAGVLLAALALPSGVLTARGEMPSFLGSSPLWSEAAAQILVWQQGGSIVGGVPAMVGAALAAAALVPLLTASVAARDSAAALRAGGLAVGWSLLTALLFAAVLLWGSVVFSRVIVGKAPDRLPDAVYTASAAGLVDICGGRVASPAAARAACARRGSASAPLAVADAKPRAALLLVNLAGASGAGAAGVGLLTAAVLAVGLTLAAAGFFLCATALGHDMFYRVRSRQAQTSRRLAVTRALLVGTLALGAAVTGARDIDARLLIGLAAALAAAAILPLLALSVHPRVIGRDAVIALLIGLVGAEAVLFAQEPTLDVLLRAALAGAVSGVVAGLAAATILPGDRSESRAFVDAVLHGKGDVLAPDKGV